MENFNRHWQATVKFYRGQRVESKRRVRPERVIAMKSYKHATKRRRRKQQPMVAVINYRAAQAAMLDRLADLELQHGHHHAAEHLAHRAAELREGAQ